MRSPSDLRPYYPEFLMLLGEARRTASAPAQEVQDALARLKEGAFGDCEECDAAIPLERLRRCPVARLCIACQVAKNRSPRAAAAVSA